MNAPQRPFLRDCDGIRESCRLSPELSLNLAYSRADRLLSGLNARGRGRPRVAHISPQRGLFRGISRFKALYAVCRYRLRTCRFDVVIFIRKGGKYAKQYTQKSSLAAAGDMGPD